MNHFSFSALKITSLTMAMQRVFVSKKKTIV